MTNLLLRIFLGKRPDLTDTRVRERCGKLAGAVGLVSNLLLFAFKLLVGTVTGSIAILADAVNNLSDGASSIITLVAFHLAGVPADERHPYGHARFEYISGLVVSFLVLAIGFEFLLSSVRKILSPQSVAFSPAVAAVLVAAILLKLWQGAFNRTVGRRIGSTALLATAADSRNDVITTAAVLAGAVLEQLTGLQLDGWLGLLVALFILVSGVKLVAETVSPLLGAAPDKALVEDLQHRILGYDSILGLHDLIVHSYGPGHTFASVHVEVPANQDILASHDIIDNIEREVAAATGVELVVHMDPVVTDDTKLNSFRSRVAAVVSGIDPQLSIHDFRMVEGKTHTNLIFDVVVPPRYRLSDNALRLEIAQRVAGLQEGLFCVITVDRSYTSTQGEER